MRITDSPRRRVLRRLLSAATLAAFATFGLHATAPTAHADPLMDCIEAVDDIVSGCLGEDAGAARNFVCKWAGGVGYMACIVGEAAKEIAKKLPLAA
jgi:hypothetical protein